MSLSLEKLTELLTECDVSASEQLRDALARVDRTQADVAAECLVAELLNSAMITPLQSELLLDGRSLMMGHYVLCEKIGEGGMGTVYAARHRHMGRMVALKVIRADRFRDPGSIERFRREIQLAARLRHTNIVVAYDAGEAHDALYLVMELVDGCDLARHVRRHGVLDVPAALDAVRQAACGLAYLHSQKLVHRDIKPSNLLRDRQGVIKILDLGLSRLVEWSEAAHTGVYRTGTVPGEPMGSVDYMSPEQFVNARLVDARADLYSLGCTLYGLLAGRPPFPGTSVGERIIAHRERPVPSLREVVPEVPARLDRLFQSLLAKDPNQRPSDAHRVLAEIKALGILCPAESVPPAVAASDLAETEVLPSEQALARPRTRKQRAALWAGTVAGIALALAAAIGSRYRSTAIDKTASRPATKRVAPTTAKTIDRPADRRPSGRVLVAEDNSKAAAPEPDATAAFSAKGDKKATTAATPSTNGSPDPAPRPADKDQSAALWAFKVGGEVLVQCQLGFFSARSPGDLPTVPFQVVRLNLAGCSLAMNDPSPLAELRNLQLIDFGRSDVSDSVLGALSQITSLTDLSLMQTKIGDEGIKHLDSLAKLSRLDLRGTSVTDAGVKHFAARHSLEDLRLGEEQRLTDAGAESLADMQSLKNLGLRATAITDKAVVALAGLERLEWLDLGRCDSLTDESLVALGKYKSLKRVILDGVRVSANAVSELEREHHVQVDR